MKVKLNQAVKMFFGSSSLEMVYFEAIANSLDAGATEIAINIQASAFNKPESIQIVIEDNGAGFTDDRYKKFSNLFDVDESSHKGLGRLVYLCYFDEIQIVSYYNRNQQREFKFSNNFDEEDFTVSEVKDRDSGTVLKMSSYTLSKLKRYDYIQPKYIKKRLLEEFYSQLFMLKNDKKDVKIKIKATVEGKTTSEVLKNSDIPKFEKIQLDSSINLIDNFYLYYSIKDVSPPLTSLVAAISVDNRTIKVEIIADENIPNGYDMVFLLYSDYFKGKVDASRQNLEIQEQDYLAIQNLFRKKVAEIIEKKIPKIKARNEETKKNLVNRYPHLTGYFNIETVGYASRGDVLKKAQDQFFKAQKELLDANSLTDEQYDKSIELSSRALAEYILFRQITIQALKKTTNENSEAELHKLFATMRTQFDKKNVVNDLYKNNAWLLDDKYMTYETILSEREMGDLIKEITDDKETLRDDDRPDIALIFSNNPDKAKFFDVVIVELKKRGISLEENMKTITQLEKRARKLMKYYNNRIQRIWYYGIIEFNEEIELALSGEYQELYSAGKMYYRETNVAIQKDPKITIPIGVFIWDIDSVVNDAEARNSAFLNLIKSRFKQE